METDTNRVSLAGSVGSPTDGDSLGAAVEAAPSPVMLPTGNNGATHSSPDTVVDSPSSATGPRAKRRVRWVDIEDEAYEGFKFRMWVNYPQSFDTKIKPGASEEEIAEVLNKVFLEHNGWCDEEGTPYPAANHPNFWNVIPNELAAAIVTLIRLEGTKLSNLLMQKQMNTARTLGRNG
jgi:hypothetical protein